MREGIGREQGQDLVVKVDQVHDKKQSSDDGEGDLGRTWIEIWPAARVLGELESRPPHCGGVVLFAGTGANTVYGLHDTLVQNISEKQWQTINAYLKTKRVDLTARSLGVNLSTVSRNLKRGYLRQLEETVATMTEFMNRSFPDCT